MGCNERCNATLFFGGVRALDDVLINAEPSPACPARGLFDVDKLVQRGAGITSYRLTRLADLDVHTYIDLQMIATR